MKFVEFDCIAFHLYFYFGSPIMLVAYFSKF